MHATHPSRAIGVVALSAFAHAACFALLSRRAHAVDGHAEGAEARAETEVDVALVEVSLARDAPWPSEPAPLRALDAEHARGAPRAREPAAHEERDSRTGGEDDADDKGRGVDLRDVGGLLASLERRLATPLPDGFVHLPDREPPEASLRPPYPWVSDGRIPRDAIKRVVRANGAALRACIEARGQEARVAGHLAVTLKVGPTGRVRAARSLDDGEMADADVVACVERSFVGLAFPPPERGSATVTVPVYVGARR